MLIILAKETQCNAQNECRVNYTSQRANIHTNYTDYLPCCKTLLPFSQPPPRMNKDILRELGMSKIVKLAVYH